MATSKYVRASLELPFARLAFAEETKEAIGVSGGMSDGERARMYGKVRTVAPSARAGNGVSIIETSNGQRRGGGSQT